MRFIGERYETADSRTRVIRGLPGWVGEPEQMPCTVSLQAGGSMWSVASDTPGGSFVTLDEADALEALFLMFALIAEP